MSNKSTKKTYQVSDSFIIKSHANASSEKEKREIEAQFPDLFLIGKPYDFGVVKEHTVSTDINSNFPLYVGFGLAPKDLEGKCLLVQENWNVELSLIQDPFSPSDRGPIQMLVFKRKK